jgi:hypothetical protein
VLCRIAAFGTETEVGVQAMNPVERVDGCLHPVTVAIGGSGRLRERGVPRFDPSPVPPEAVRSPNAKMAFLQAAK